MASVTDGWIDWGRLLSRLVAVGLLAAVLWRVGGLEATLLVPVVAVGWLVASTASVFAVGQLLFAVLLADAVAAPLVGVAAFGVLFLATYVDHWSAASAAVGAVSFGVAWAGLAATSRVEPLWAGAGALLVAFALFAYALHRIELVALGLVSREEEPA